NLGDPELSPCVNSPAVGTGRRTPGPRSAFWTDGSEATDATQGIAGRRQPRPARGTQEVGAFHSTVEPGEPDPWGPGGGKEGPSPARTRRRRCGGCTCRKGRVPRHARLESRRWKTKCFSGRS